MLALAALALVMQSNSNIGLLQLVGHTCCETLGADHSVASEEVCVGKSSPFCDSSGEVPSLNIGELEIAALY